jgi:hypothetical protein
MPMKFRLKFINSVGQIVRELNIEADDDDAATDYISNQSIYFNMAVELWRANEFVVRMTPMTARLYLPTEGVPYLKSSASAR